MKRFLRLILLLALHLMISSSCSSSDSSPPQAASPFECASTPVAKGSREFGMDILDVPGVGSYDDSLQNLKSMGGTFQTYHVNWNTIEGAGTGTTTSGPLTDPGNGLANLNALANSEGIKITLRIHPVDVPGKAVPADLNSLRFNDPVMLTRFQNMLSFVFTKISPANVTRLVVGNEVDGYNPGSDVNFWLDYSGTFLFGLNIWLNSNYPGIELGFAVTSAGATDPSKTLYSSGGQRSIDVLGDSGWAAAVDFIGITYYPLDTSFQMQGNSLVSTMFQNLVAFTAKPIHIEEVGYASSTTSLGSENLQAEFFCEVFKAWDTHASRISSLAALRMVDKSRSDSESVATTYGLTGNENFIEYIRSLGIRTYDNQPKRSFTIIASELQKRGF